MFLRPNWRSLTSLFHRDQQRKSRRRRRIALAVVSVFVIFLLGIFSYFTNPFTEHSMVQDPYWIRTNENGGFVLEKDQTIRVRSGWLSRRAAWAKHGWLILSSAVNPPKSAPETNVEAIIDEILTLRFDPQRPFLISGDHFSMLYPRSLGVFYHSALDPRTVRNESDWWRRQALILKTTAYALDAFSASNRLTTTIVPIGSSTVALINVFQPPADTLYSLLYALTVLQSPQEHLTRYPFPHTSTYVPQTQQAALLLLLQHTDWLQASLATFTDELIDPQTQRIRPDKKLSATKDGTIRQSAFADNVTYWKTLQLAQELGLQSVDTEKLDLLKTKILTTYWNDQAGFFREDLWPNLEESEQYSSDWLTAYQLGLLDPKSKTDRVYLERSVAYIQTQKLDRPFGLFYQHKVHRDRLYPFVRWFAPSYGTTTIWSNLGMEYTKLLTALYQETYKPEYLTEAQYQVQKYTENIQKFQGFPEVYDKNGQPYRQIFYQSVRQTGWVVSFLQAREYLRWVEANDTCQESSSSKE